MRDESISVGAEIGRVRERLHLVDGISVAMRDPHAVLDVLFNAANPDAALGDLQEHFDLSKLQAQVLLDAQFRQVTEQTRRRVEAEREELERHLAHVERLSSE